MKQILPVLAVGLAVLAGCTTVESGTATAPAVPVDERIAAELAAAGESVSAPTVTTMADIVCERLGDGATLEQVHAEVNGSRNYTLVDVVRTTELVRTGFCPRAVPGPGSRPFEGPYNRQSDPALGSSGQAFLNGVQAALDEEGLPDTFGLNDTSWETGPPAMAELHAQGRAVCTTLDSDPDLGVAVAVQALGAGQTVEEAAAVVYAAITNLCLHHESLIFG